MATHTVIATRDTPHDSREPERLQCGDIISLACRQPSARVADRVFPIQRYEGEEGQDDEAEANKDHKEDHLRWQEEP